MTAQANSPKQLPADVGALLDAAADRYAVPRSLARAHAWIESRGDQAARGRAGEVGVMQLMPATAKGLGVDPYDVRQNIEGGVRYIAQQFRRFGLERGIAAYNGGPKYGAYTPAQLPASIARYVGLIKARMGIEDELAKGAAPRTAPLAGGTTASTSKPTSQTFDEETTPARPRRRTSQPPAPSSPQSSTGKGSDCDDDPNS